MCVCGMMLFRTMWAPEYRLLFWSVLQFFSVFGFSCCHTVHRRVYILCSSFRWIILDRNTPQTFSLPFRAEDLQQNTPPVLCLEPPLLQGGGTNLEEDGRYCWRIDVKLESPPSRSLEDTRAAARVGAGALGFPPTVCLDPVLPVCVFGSSPSSCHCLLRLKRGGCHGHVKRVRFSLQVVFASPGSAGMCVCFSSSGILLGSYRVVMAPWKSDYVTACAGYYDLCFSFCGLQSCRRSCLSGVRGLTFGFFSLTQLGRKSARIILVHFTSPVMFVHED